MVGSRTTMAPSRPPRACWAVCWSLLDMVRVTVSVSTGVVSRSPMVLTGRLCWAPGTGRRWPRRRWRRSWTTGTR